MNDFGLFGSNFLVNWSIFVAHFFVYRLQILVFVIFKYKSFSGTT